MQHTTILPWWLLAGVIALGVGLGWATLDVTGSVVAMSLATAASWPVVMLARRVRAARGNGPRFEELPSGSDAAPFSRLIVAHMTSVLGYLVVAAGLGVLLSDLEPEAVDAMSAGELIALLAAAPVFTEIDARMGIRGARLRREDEQRLRAVVGQEHLTMGDGVITLPVARMRPLLLAGFLLACAVVVAATATGVVLAALSIGVAVIALRPARIALRSPFFLQLSAEGVDPLGRGLVPWAAIGSFDIGAAQGWRYLTIVLSPDSEPDRASWWQKGHRALGRGRDNAALSLQLMFCRATDEELLAALGNFADRPVTVGLD